MLTLVLKQGESWDERNNEFITPSEPTLELEHSLVSISKWESKWKKPFLGDKNKTDEEAIDYIRCMTLTPDVSPEVYELLTNEDIKKVSAYIDDPMSATWFNDTKPPPGRQDIVTAEIIYYWLIALTIPFECQHWHLNQLLTLVKVCNQKNAPQKAKKLTKSDLERRRELNALRKQQQQTKG